MKHIKTGKERTKEDLSALRKTVSEIIEDVVANGDAALRSYLFPRKRTGTQRYEVCARQHPHVRRGTASDHP